jgi:hypothetical protein
MRMAWWWSENYSVSHTVPLHLLELAPGTDISTLSGAYASTRHALPAIRTAE